MKCPRCGTPVARERVGPRDACERCSAYLHCCRNCAFYAPGAANDCREPGVDPVADKEAGNFCEWFRFAEEGQIAGSGSAKASAKAEEARRRLEGLFGRK